MLPSTAPRTETYYSGIENVISAWIDTNIGQFIIERIAYSHFTPDDWFIHKLEANYTSTTYIH